MSVYGQTETRLPRSVLAIISLTTGLMAQVFPAVSLFLLVVQNGGAGYVQSLICGAPIAVIGILSGVAVLVHDRTQGRQADWRAVTGVGLSVVFYVAALLLTVILLAPFFLWGAE